MSAAKLTREAVVERALALGDEEGLKAVTIRRLAQELGVTPMALYWHFKTKELLLIGMIDHLMQEVVVKDADGWLHGLRLQTEALVRMLRAHPCMPDVLHTADKQRSENFSRATEAALGFLSQGGFALDEAYIAASYLLSGAGALVTGEPGCPHHVEDPKRWLKERKSQLQNLDEDEFPKLRSYAQTMTTDPDVESYYAFGIDLLMSGIEGMSR